tara:strand:+ start:185 stop:394 length:210 start_codon:yes stop_codon:yes gene_type:complete
MIKKLIEKIFGRFCKCKEKTTSELLREGFDEEQEALKLEYEEVIENSIVCTTHNRFKKSCLVCQGGNKK